jgi:hypothetical protein
MASMNDIIENAMAAQNGTGVQKPKQDRPPLVWQDVHEVIKGNVRAIVEAADTGRYSVYSFRFARSDRPTSHIGLRTTQPTAASPSRVEDEGIALDLGGAAAEAIAWINARLEAAHASKISKAYDRDLQKDSFGVKAPRVTGKTERDRLKKKVG